MARQVKKSVLDGSRLRYETTQNKNKYEFSDHYFKNKLLEDCRRDRFTHFSRLTSEQWSRYHIFFAPNNGVLLEIVKKCTQKVLTLPNIYV